MTNGFVFTQSAFDSSFNTSTGQTIGAGVMSPEASDRFIDSLFRLTSLYDRANIIQMGAPTRRITKASFGKRILRPGTAGIAPGYFAQASVSEVELNAQLMKATVKITDEELEDNIIKGDLTNYVMGKIQDEVANEIEYACLMGQNTGLSGNPVYIDNQLNGWYYNAKSNGGQIVLGDTLADAGYLVGGTAGANTRHYTKKKASVAARAIPAKYKAKIKNFTHFVSPGVYEEMIDTYADRPTPGGDVAYRAGGLEPNLPGDFRSTMGMSAYPFTVAPLIPENLFYDKQSGQYSSTVSSGGAAGTNTFTPASTSLLAVGDGVILGTRTTPMAERATVTNIASGVVTVSCPDTADGNFVFNHAGDTVKNGTLDRTFMLTTWPDNLLVGVWRSVRVEPTRWGPESSTYFTLSLRMDVQLALPDGVAIVDNMTAVIQ